LQIFQALTINGHLYCVGFCFVYQICELMSTNWRNDSRQIVIPDHRRHDVTVEGSYVEAQEKHHLS